MGHNCLPLSLGQLCKVDASLASFRFTNYRYSMAPFISDGRGPIVGGGTRFDSQRTNHNASSREPRHFEYLKPSYGIAVFVGVE